MEGRIKEKTLRRMFLQYMVLFCINTLVICGIVVGVLFVLTEQAGLLPANYTEQWLGEHEKEIRVVEDVSSLDFPEDSRYGVYTEDGVWLDGTIPKEERKKVWEGYQKRSMAAVSGYYRFFSREDGTVCIVNYYFRMQYASPKLNRILPSPELLLPLAAVILFILQAVFLAGRFSKNLKRRLEQLEGVTQKISENDLEFDVETTDIREINEVLHSLGRMKEALQTSLKKQWDMEAEQNRQVRALVHDIKTPLTIIRGNAELAAEDMKLLERELSEKQSCDIALEKETLEKDLSKKQSSDIAIEIENFSRSGTFADEENKKIVNVLQSTGDAQKQILEYAKEMEQYLEKMRLILQYKTVEDREICISCGKLQEQLKMQAEQMASVKDIPVMVQCGEVNGTIQINPEQIKRAWGNILGNALEYTNPEQGIDVSVSEIEKDGKQYLCVGVSDYGSGFSGEALARAAEEFYRGDESRHDRSHQGLGLSIAKWFVEAQGGFLEVKNSEKSGGGEVSLFIPHYSENRKV